MVQKEDVVFYNTIQYITQYNTNKFVTRPRPTWIIHLQAQRPM